MKQKTETTLRRGAILPNTGKTRVTMYLDDDVIEYFRERATQAGRGYQTEINSELRAAMSGANLPAARSDDLAQLRAELKKAVSGIESLVRVVKVSKASKQAGSFKVEKQFVPKRDRHTA